LKPDRAGAGRDILDGLRAWPIWTRLGWQEVKRRYRRTVLGPFWATLSLGLFIGAISFVWAPLFGTQLDVYLPFFASGMVAWTLASTIVNESCTNYAAGEGLIKQLNFPFSILVFVTVWRNLIVFFHHLVILVLIYLVYPPASWGGFLLVPLGLLIVAVHGVSLGTFIGMVCTRFRDVSPLIGNLTQVMLFVTPIFWSANQLGQKGEFFIQFNYLYHLVRVVREPLRGDFPGFGSYAITIAGGMISCLLVFEFYARFRRRIVYWL
jgi:ABC-type polysaccharide/polyol phosphate export permease